MSLKNLFRISIGIQFVLIALLAVLSIYLYQNQKELSKSRNTLFQTYLLADELRQSSDDLTRMVRTYVATGNPEYETQYWTVLDIRNGKTPRPVNYSQIYWDLVLGAGQKPRQDGEAISLRNIMLNNGITNAEFEKLNEANKISDKLVETEKVAMNAMKGLYKDSEGNFTIRKQADPKFALHILNDEAYHSTKAKIMKPIDEFFEMINERTATNVEFYEQRSSNLLKSIVIIIFLFFGMFIVSNVILQKHITAQRRSEEALRESENRYKEAIENATDIIFTTDINGNYLFSNSASLRISGYSLGEMQTKNYFDVIQTEYRRKVQIFYMRQFKNNLPTSYLEYPLVTKTGEIIWLGQNANLVLEKDEIIGFHLIARDITEQKRAEEALRRSEANLAEAQSIAHIGSWEWDMVSNKVQWSQQVFKVFDVSPETYDGKPETLLNFVHPDDLEIVKNSINANLEDGRSPSLEYRIVHKDGSIHHIIAEGKFEFDYNGKPIRNIGTAQDITERKKAEEILSQNRAELKAIYDYSPVMMCVVDSNRNVIFANPAFSSLTGTTEEQLIGGKACGVFGCINALDDINGCGFGKNCQNCNLKSAMEDTLKNGTNHINIDYETTLLMNGETREVSMLGSTSFILRNNQPHLLLYLLDITDRKQAEEVLKKSEKRNADMLANIGDVIVIIDKDGINRYKSPNIEKLFGWKPEDVIGNSTWDNVHSDDLESAQNFIGSLVVEPNKTGSTECRYLCKDGTYKWIEFTGVNLLQDPEICGILGNYHDISERKETEQALQESEERYSTIVNSTPNIILIHKDGVLLYVNEVAERSLGFSKEEAIGKQMFDFVADESKQIAYLNMQKRAAGEDVPAYEANVLTKSGTKKAMLIQVTVIPYNNEKVFLAVLTDITDLKNAAMELQSQNQQIEAQYEEYLQLNELLHLTNYDLVIAKEHAEESDKLKTAFLQNMSHEIRTPLNGIIGFTGLLQDDDITKEEIKEYTGVIQNSGYRLIELVNNVLDISKIETGQVEINNKSFSVNSIITNLNSFFSPIANAKELKLNAHTFLDDSNCIVNLDDAKLHQILTNLINNSIKFTNTGSIDFGYEIVGNEIQFYVKDTGSGISAEDQEKIFERFTQANSAITRGYEGAGLGLAICRGLVELMGGRIWVESEAGKGSTFFFNLPYCPSSLAENFKQKRADIGQHQKRVKILIAEDDRTSFEFLKKILKSDKYMILRAENGQQAIDIVKATPDIDLILMDIKMPVLNGMEATKQIKQIKPDLPIIAQTAYAFNEEMEEILSIGCDDYIIKPIEKDKLLVLIEKYV